MTTPLTNQMIDLEIRIFQRQDEGYPVEITLGEQQEFPRGFLSPDILPWSPSNDLSSDGQRLATSSWDQTVRLWDLSQSPPKTMAVLTGHTGYIPSVTFSSDGMYVASGSRDRTVRRYLANFADVVDLSWEYVPRKVTEEEQELLNRLEFTPFGY